MTWDASGYGISRNHGISWWLAAERRSGLDARLRGTASADNWLRSFVGAFVPAGSQRSSLNNGATLGLQGAYAFNSYFAAVGSVAWSASEEKSFLQSDVDVYQYDLGAEAGFDKQVTSALKLHPFIGLGSAGARTTTPIVTPRRSTTWQGMAVGAPSSRWVASAGASRCVTT